MKQPSRQLTSVEGQAAARIQAIRDRVARGEIPQATARPEILLHDLIQHFRGNAKLRLGAMAPTLGVSTRTLQRNFRKAYKISPQAFQVAVRLRYAQYLISIGAEPKISGVAHLLGYQDANAFERFFHVHSTRSPRAWGNAEGRRKNYHPKGKS